MEPVTFTAPVKINEKSAAMLKGIINDEILHSRRVGEAVNAMRVALEIPDTWQFDIVTFIFMPPTPKAPV
jgi:hypothetical protein